MNFVREIVLKKNVYKIVDNIHNNMVIYAHGKQI